MRPAAVGFAAGSDVQAIGDGDFLFAEGTENPMLLVNVTAGDNVSIVIVPLSGVGNASVYNANFSEATISVTFARDTNSYYDIYITREGENPDFLGVEFGEIMRWIEDRGGGAAAVSVSVNSVFCGRVLAFDAQHTVEDAKAIPLPVLLNGNWTNTSSVEHPMTSYVHCEESTEQDPLAWFDFPGSNPNQQMTAAHFEIFMFNAEASMLSITTMAGPNVYINKRRYGLVVDVEPYGEEMFSLVSSKLFGEDPAWWCQLTEI